MHTNTLHRIQRGGLLASLALLAHATALHAAATYTVKPTVDFHVWDFNPANGVGDGGEDTGPFTIGERDSADGAINRLERAILTFSLPPLAPDEFVVSATLRLFVTGATNQGGQLGNAALYHSQTQNGVAAFSAGSSPAFYQDASYLSTGLSVATPGTTLNTWTETAVTSFVQLDYAGDGLSTPVSAFRLQVDGLGFTEDNLRHLYSFAGKVGGADAANAAQLVIVTSTIPEPSSFAALAGMAGLGFAAGRRSRRQPAC